MGRQAKAAGIGTRVTLGLAGLLSLALVGCSESQAPGCGGLKVDAPWVREAASGAEVMGAYFTLVNDGDSKVVINGVSSSQFDRAEMHETVVNDDGQASMQPIERVSVAPGESVEFKSGGRHVMLFSPSQAYAAGDQVELILACGERGGELPVAATVRTEKPSGSGADGAGDSMDHGSMDHDDMDTDESESQDERASQAMPEGDAETAGAANADSASAE
jgi:hypothetical protein